MIGVLTHHWALPHRVGDARMLLNGNGRAQSRAPGYVSRQTLLAHSDATKITTLVNWQSNEAYDAWRASPERAAAMAGADDLWARLPESERFEVAP